LQERASRAHGVDAGQKAADPFEHVSIIQLRGTTTAQGADREIETRALVQSLTIQHQGGDHRHFCCQQFGGKVVLFLNLFATPAARPIKLQDHGRVALHRLIQVGTVDAVFV